MCKIYFVAVWLSLSLVTASQNLVAYYPFNGNANDESGNAINATYVGSGVTLTTDRFGNANKAYYFDGAAGSYIRVPADNFPTTDRTISFWFNADQLGYYVPTPFSYGGNVCNNSLLMIINHYNYTNSYLVEAHCGANAISAPYITEPVNNWYHLTLTISGSTQKIFVNGVLQQSTNSFTSPTYVTGTSALLGACIDPDGNTAWAGFFQGKLDDFRVYDNALSDAQVQQLYYIESNTFLPDLLVYLPMNANANDVSGNAYHGTVNGTELTPDKYNSNNAAYRFPAENTNITLANSTGFDFQSSGFTLSSWIKYNSTDGVIISKHNCWTANGFVFKVENNQLAFYLANGGNWTTITTNETFVTGKWYHVVAVYDGASQASIYVNGELKASGPAIFNSVNNAPVIISGASGSCPQVNFGGSMDEVKIYGSPLDAAQVMSLYKQSKSSGNAIKFDGVDDKINVGTGWESSNFTFEAWVKPDMVSNLHTLISPAGNEGLGILLDNAADFNNTQTVRLLVFGSWTPLCTIN